MGGVGGGGGRLWCYPYFAHLQSREIADAIASYSSKINVHLDLEVS